MVYRRKPRRSGVARKILWLKNNKCYTLSLVLVLLLLLIIAVNPCFPAGTYDLRLSIDDSRSDYVVKVFFNYIIFYDNKTVTEIGDRSVVFYIDYNGTRYFLTSVKPTYLEPIFVGKTLYFVVKGRPKTTVRLVHNVTGDFIPPIPIGSPVFGVDATYMFRWPIKKPVFVAEFKLRSYIRSNLGLKAENHGNGRAEVAVEVVYDTGDVDRIVFSVGGNSNYTKYLGIGEGRLVEDVKPGYVNIYINGLKYRYNTSSKALTFFIRDNPLIAIILVLVATLTPILVREISTKLGISITRRKKEARSLKKLEWLKERRRRKKYM